MGTLIGVKSLKIVHILNPDNISKQLSLHKYIFGENILRPHQKIRKQKHQFKFFTKIEILEN